MKFCDAVFFVFAFHSLMNRGVVVAHISQVHAKRGSHPQEVNNDAGEVDVADNHDVEMAEELQFSQVHCSLAISL